MAILQRARKSPEQESCFGPESNGILMSAREFDRADFADGLHYELINGVLIVTPIPALGEAVPNDELAYLLRKYRHEHPQGKTLDETAVERYVRLGQNRRRADRVIWANLGRVPREHETPTIAVEFPSRRKRDRLRDYETKRDEYLQAGVKEYWIIDRFRLTMTIYTRVRGKNRTRVLQADQSYRTDLLPGFELPLARLFELGNRWNDDATEE